MKGLILLVLVSMLLFAAELDGAQGFEFLVEHQRLLRNHRGTLIITPDRIEYKTSHKDESRSWQYVDIQQIKIESPIEIEIMTYEDQKRLLGRDRVFKFKLLDGEITPEISALLMAKATRPIATSVMPATAGAPTYEVPVKHLHSFGGCEGVLKIYPDRVTYESTEKREDSRYWRYSDIQQFGQPERYRFEITSFEDQLGRPTRVFNFQLKQELPALAYDYLWMRIYPSKFHSYEKAAQPPDEKTAGKTAQPVSEKVAPPTAQPQRHPAQQKSEPEVQSAIVAVTETGYEPASITLRPGVLARVTFVRKVEGGCGTEIVIPEYKIKRELPLNEPVVVEFTPGKSGQFNFTCGMDMLRGKIVVEER